MPQMKIDQQLAALTHIEKVETPPYVFAQIKQRINNQKIQVTMQWKFTFAAAALIIVTLNVMAFIHISTAKEAKEIQQMAEVMQLSTTNNLYNE